MKTRTGWGAVGWALHQTGARELGAGLLQRVGRQPGAGRLGAVKEAGSRWGAGRHRTAVWGGGATQWGLGKGRRGLQCVLVKVYRPLCGEKPCFVAFASFCAVSTPVVASFKLPTLNVGQEEW